MSPPTPEYAPPGRLGNPEMSVGEDPRINQRLLQGLKATSLDREAAASPLTVDVPFEQLDAAMAASDHMMQGMYDAMDVSVPGDADGPEVRQTTTTITGVDGNKIALHTFRVAGTEHAVLPGMLYTHGGGMTILSTINPVHVATLKAIARAGLVCIAVDFRNAHAAGAYHPFPAGLNDCAAAARHIVEHQADFGISRLIIMGESGGGNLAIATTLKAHREGWSHRLAGTFAAVPFISGAYGWPDGRRRREIPSTVECEGYFLGLRFMELMAHYYVQDDSDRANPLAWPYFATEEDLTGLPPMFVWTDELDPLRDEGLAFWRKASRAGVEVAGCVNLGSTHAGWLIFRKWVPEMNGAFVDAVAGFAKRVKTPGLLDAGRIKL